VNGQDFWHSLAGFAGLFVVVYAIKAKEFRRRRLFTTGPEQRFKPNWYDRVWLVAVGLFFLIASVAYFLHRLK
jgi:hypothetical protein